MKASLRVPDGGPSSEASAASAGVPSVAAEAVTPAPSQRDSHEGAPPRPEAGAVDEAGGVYEESGRGAHNPAPAGGMEHPRGKSGHRPGQGRPLAGEGRGGTASTAQEPDDCTASQAGLSPLIGQRTPHTGSLDALGHGSIDSNDASTSLGGTARSRHGSAAPISADEDIERGDGPSLAEAGVSSKVDAAAAPSLLAVHETKPHPEANSRADVSDSPSPGGDAKLHEASEITTGADGPSSAVDSAGGSAATAGAAAPRAANRRNWNALRDRVGLELRHAGAKERALQDVLMSPRANTGVEAQSCFQRWRAWWMQRKAGTGTGECGRWCFVARRPAIPASDRESVRRVVYRLHNSPSIDPECLFASVWKVVSFVVIVCQAISVPFRLGYDPDVADPLWRPGLSGADLWLYFMDILYVADMVMSMRTGYIENGNKIVDLALTRRRFLRRPNLGMEVASVLPYDIILGVIIGPTNGSFVLFATRLTRLMRCRHLPQLFADAEDAGGVHFRNLHQLFKMMTFVLLLVHLHASLWFFLSRKAGFAPEDSSAKESFLAPAGLQHEALGAQYVSSLYWAVRQATSEGIVGPPNVTSSLENAMSLFVTLSGVLLVSYMIGARARLMSQLDASWAQHTARLSQIHRFLAHNGLSNELARDIDEYYEFSYEESGGKDVQSVAGYLSNSLQGHLTVVMTRDILRKVPLFAHVEEGLVVSLAKTLLPITMQRGQLVMRAGLPCKRVYLVHWGSLSIEVGGTGDVRVLRARLRARAAHATVNVRDDTEQARWGSQLLRRSDPFGSVDEGEVPADCRQRGTVIGTLSHGSFFGQYVQDSKGYVPTTSVRTDTFCILYALEHETLSTVLPRFPRSQQKVERMLSQQWQGSVVPDYTEQLEPREKTTAEKTESKNWHFWVAVAATRLAGSVQRRSPNCCRRLKRSRFVQRSPCAWLLRDCCIRGVQSEPGRSTEKVDYDDVSPKSANRVGESPLARLHTPAAARRRRERGDATVIGVSPLSRIAPLSTAKRVIHEISIQNAITPQAGGATWWRGNIGAGNLATPSSRGSGARDAASGTQRSRGHHRVEQASSWVLNPHSNFRWTWQTLMQLTVLYNIITVPLHVAFSSFVTEREKQTGSSVVLTIDAALNVIYLCDLVVSARMAMFSRGVLVRDPRLLLRIYMTQGGFWRDAISSVPLDWIFGASWWTRINKLARASRLLVWIRSWVLQLTAAGSSAHAVASTLLQLVFMLITSFHYLTCLYWVFATASRGSDPLWPDDTFSAPPNLDDEGLLVQYMYAAYRVSHPGGLLRGTTPPTGEAALFCFAITIYGLFLFAYVIGALGTVIADTDVASARFRERKMAVERFLNMRRVPSSDRDLVSHWFRVEWQNNNGLSVSSVCAGLPKSLTRRLRYELCGGNLRRAAIFATLDDKSLVLLAEVLQIEMLADGQVLFHAGELGTDMFVVVGGAVSLYFDEYGGRLVTDLVDAIARAKDGTPREKSPPKRVAKRMQSRSGSKSLRQHASEWLDIDDMRDPFSTVGPGDVGGEFAYFEGVRLTTAIAACATELYIINYDMLHNILKRRPFLESRMRLLARKKLFEMSAIVNFILQRNHIPAGARRTSSRASRFRSQSGHEDAASAWWSPKRTMSSVTPAERSTVGTRTPSGRERVVQDQSAPIDTQVGPRDRMSLASRMPAHAQTSDPRAAHTEMSDSGSEGKPGGGDAYVGSTEALNGVDEPDPHKKLWRIPLFAASGSLAADTDADADADSTAANGAGSSGGMMLAPLSEGRFRDG